MGLTSRKSACEHIDTNIIIRLITRDDPKMTKKAERLLAKKDKIYIFEDAAMMEVVFVLTGEYYHYDRDEAAASIMALSKIDNLYFNKGLIEEALNLYVGHPKLSFVDCYLAAATTLSGETPLWTCDHKLATQCPVAQEL